MRRSRVRACSGCTWASDFQKYIRCEQCSFVLKISDIDLHIIKTSHFGDLWGTSISLTVCNRSGKIKRYQKRKSETPIVILTSLVKFNSYFKVISKVFFHKNEQVVGCTSPLSLLRLVRADCRVSVCSSSFTAASWTNVFNMKGRRPSTRSTSSRASLVDSTGRKMLSEVLLVCELMMFITLSALTGGTPQSASTHSQKKQSKVCF